MLVHFPIALFLAGVGFDFFGQWRKKRALAAVAYYDLASSGRVVGSSRGNGHYWRGAGNWKVSGSKGYCFSIWGWDSYQPS